jgi:hypothetical protein
MATTKEKPLTERQRAALDIAKAMVSATGYEILDEGNGEIARSLARRATQIADTVIVTAAGPDRSAA